MVVAGFEPLDVLHSIWMVLRQIEGGPREVENQYCRIVPEEGNRRRCARSRKVYELREFFEWRGLGSIDHSGVRMRDAYARLRRRAQDSRAECARSPIRNPANAARC